METQKVGESVPPGNGYITIGLTISNDYYDVLIVGDCAHPQLYK